MKKSMLALLVLNFIFSSCSPAPSDRTTDLMKSIKTHNIAPIAFDKLNEQQTNKRKEIFEFSLNIFKENFRNDKNTLLSPLSIISALGMVANGAKNETLSQMENAFNTDIQELNTYLQAYVAFLPSNNKYKVSLANSIWFKDDESLNINADFLQTNKNYYDASIYEVLFNENTKNDINNWVREKTDGQIDEILKKTPPPDAIMYLINALSFDAEWAKIYEDTQIHVDKFTLENGEKQDSEFMNSKEYQYLEAKNATGFIKPYKDNTYAFVALLPNKNVNFTDFLNTLRATELIALLENPRQATVFTQIPKFSSEFSASLNKSLQNLGITDAFSTATADFSSLGESSKGTIFISEVMHKTKIDVNEKGTKAGAVTAILLMKNSMIQDPKEVRLNRPFFYMIVDREQNLPLFMGTLMNREEAPISSKK